jgi:hypothetical protein
MTSREMSIVEFNREVLKNDLRKIKPKIRKIKPSMLQELDNYFEVVCDLACMDADIFKSFVRKLVKEKYKKPPKQTKEERRKWMLNYYHMNADKQAVRIRENKIRQGEYSISF